MPQTLTLQRRGDIEYYAKLSQQSETAGIATTAQIHAGGLYYYQAWNVLSFQLQDADITPFKMIYLGELNAALIKALQVTKPEFTAKLI
ncbi:cyclophilin-like fold protein [Loigolactobacillus binensis]|uniref:Cyclophilin-like fold protein n=1 Tax=Loigolactobacillus binensis TaxID=2559922 RepID=A0ABW3EDM9_9LACO|nr:cyclophilin-like fold protein [Loigolactobacillus binensis]